MSPRLQRSPRRPSSSTPGRDRRNAVLPARHGGARPDARAETATHGAAPRLGVALAGYATAIVTSALTGGIVAGMAGGVDSVAATVAGQLGFWSVLVAVVFYEMPDRAVPVAQRLGLRFRWVDAPAGVVVGLATQLLVLPALYLPFRSLIDDDLSGPARDLLGGAGGVGLAVIGVSVVAVAPVVEELFFRGLLLRSVQVRWGTTTAVAGSSLFFGATHFQPLQFPALATAGAVFAFAAVRTGRLGTAITVHAAFNATTFVVIGFL